MCSLPTVVATHGDGGGAADGRAEGITRFRGYRKVNFNRLLKQAWLLLPRALFCLVYMMVVVLDLHVWLSVNNSSVVAQTPKVHKNSCWFHFPAPSSFYLFIFFICFFYPTLQFCGICGGALFASKYATVCRFHLSLQQRGVFLLLCG